MNKTTVKAIGGAINILLCLAPGDYRSRLYQKDHKIDLKGKWQYREAFSVETGITHKYYYHPGPSESSPTFLFLHGLVLDGRNFLGVDDLGKKYHLLAYEFPESSPFYRGDMNDFRYILDDFLDVLSIDLFYLCGVSFGGGVAVRYAASHARRVKSLILVSTFIMNSSRNDRHRSRELANILLKNSDNKLYWLIEKAYDLAFRGKSNPMSDLKKIVKIRDLSWYRQAVRSITSCEGPEDAIQIKCPVLALHGTKDKTVSFRSAKSISRFISQSRFEVIEGGTHAMMYFQGKLLASKISAFCESIPDQVSCRKNAQ